MHLMLLLGALGLAWISRATWKLQPGTWKSRWQNALTTFLFAPSLLLSSAIAVLLMGPQGQMVFYGDGWLSLILAGLFAALSLVLVFQLTLAGWQAQKKIQTYAKIQLGNLTGYVLQSPLPFIAQVGLWNSHLVISQGFLASLDSEHLQAAIAHEQAHVHYRDTFWFFWLGWLRRLTCWLPQTEALWQELLLLRELRADYWAAQKVDRLTLAEALLTVVKAPQLTLQAPYAALNHITDPSRLEERITALLEHSEMDGVGRVICWLWLIPVFVPLMIIPFHC